MYLQRLKAAAERNDSYEQAAILTNLLLNYHGLMQNAAYRGMWIKYLQQYYTRFTLGDLHGLLAKTLWVMLNKENLTNRDWYEFEIHKKVYCFGFSYHRYGLYDALTALVAKAIDVNYEFKAINFKISDLIGSVHEARIIMHFSAAPDFNSTAQFFERIDYDSNLNGFILLLHAAAGKLSTEYLLDKIIPLFKLNVDLSWQKMLVAHFAVLPELRWAMDNRIRLQMECGKYLDTDRAFYSHILRLCKISKLNSDEGCLQYVEIILKRPNRFWIISLLELISAKLKDDSSRKLFINLICVRVMTFVSGADDNLSFRVFCLFESVMMKIQSRQILNEIVDINKKDSHFIVSIAERAIGNLVGNEQENSKIALIEWSQKCYDFVLLCNHNIEVVNFPELLTGEMTERWLTWFSEKIVCGVDNLTSITLNTVINCLEQLCLERPVECPEAFLKKAADFLFEYWKAKDVLWTDMPNVLSYLSEKNLELLLPRDQLPDTCISKPRI